MPDINIFIIAMPDKERLRAGRKRLKDAMPAQVREAFDQSARDVEMESGEELRQKLPKGFPRQFIVPEEVLVFPAEEGEPEVTRNRRRRMREMNKNRRRKKIPGIPAKA